MGGLFAGPDPVNVVSDVVAAVYVAGDILEVLEVASRVLGGSVEIEVGGELEGGDAIGTHWAFCGRGVERGIRFGFGQNSKLVSGGVRNQPDRTIAVLAAAFLTGHIHILGPLSRVARRLALFPSADSGRKVTNA